MLNVRQRNLLSLSCVLLFDAFVLHSLSGLEFFHSKIMPLVICGILLTLCSAAILMEVRKIKLCAGVPEKENMPLGRSLYYLLPLLGLCGLVYFAGFYAGVFIFVIAYNRTAGGSWKEAILSGLIMSGLIYLIFYVALQVDLTTGLIMQYLTN